MPKNQLDRSIDSPYAASRGGVAGGTSGSGGGGAGGGAGVTSVNGDVGPAVTLDLDDIGDGATNKGFTSTEKTKLSGIEAGADVTDATNVAAAGAVMDSELIDTSAGAADAGKPVKLDSNGLLDLSMIAGVILADGTIILAADWDIGEDRAILAELLKARDGEGLKLTDDGGNGYIHLIDGGETKMRRDTPGILLNLGDLSITEGGVLLQTGFIRTSSDNDINLTIVRSLSTVGFMGMGVTGDTFRRGLIYADGKIEWGPGNADRDTNLYRSAADLLRTDDSMIIVGTLGVGIAPASTQLHVLLSDAATNAIVNVLTVGHRGGTAAAGFGAGIVVQLESSTTNDQNAGRLTWEWVTATHASRASKGKLSAYSGASEIMGLSWDSAGNVAVGNNLDVPGALTVKPGTASDTAKVGGVLAHSSAQVGNVGTGEDVLYSFSVPANTLSADGQSLTFEAFGTCANNANAKRLRVRFGSSGTNLILDDPNIITNDSITWRITGRIVRTGAATQKGMAQLAYTQGSVTGPRATVGVVTNLNQTLSGAVTFQITGEATSNNDIVIEDAHVEWCGENS